MATKLSEAQIKILTGRLTEYRTFSTDRAHLLVDAAFDRKACAGLAKRNPPLLKQYWTGGIRNSYELTPEGEKVRAELLAAKAIEAPTTDTPPAFKVDDKVRLKSTGRTGVVVKTPDERNDNCIVDYDKGDWDYVHPDDLDLIEAPAPAPAAPSEATAKFAVGDAVVWPQTPAYKMIIHMRAVNNEGWIVRPDIDDEELSLYRGYAADGELSPYEGSDLQWQLEGRQMYAKLQADLDTLREKNAALIECLTKFGYWARRTHPEISDETAYVSYNGEIQFGMIREAARLTGQPTENQKLKKESQDV